MVFDTMCSKPHATRQIRCAIAKWMAASGPSETQCARAPALRKGLYI